jgi:hypothetical protein
LRAVWKTKGHTQDGATECTINYSINVYEVFEDGSQRSARSPDPMILCGETENKAYSNNPHPVDGHLTFVELLHLLRSVN